jgi:hypothetical protein
MKTKNSQSVLGMALACCALIMLTGAKPVTKEKTILKNGNFEETVEAVNNDKVKYLSSNFPKFWSINGNSKGTVEIVSQNASGGKNFLRVDSLGMWFSSRFIDVPEEFRGNLKITVKMRGKGEVWIAFFRYNRKPHKNLPTEVIKKQKIDSEKWIDISTLYECKGGENRTLAFQIRGRIDIDDVKITLEDK